MAFNHIDEKKKPEKKPLFLFIKYFLNPKDNPRWLGDFDPGEFFRGDIVLDGMKTISPWTKPPGQNSGLTV